MPNTNEPKMPDVKDCPFCRAVAKSHDGDFVISHTLDCFFTQQYAGEMWLTSKRRIEQWNHRTDKVEELKGALKDCVLALDVLKTFHRHSEVWKAFKVTDKLTKASTLLQ